MKTKDCNEYQYNKYKFATKTIFSVITHCQFLKKIDLGSNLIWGYLYNSLANSLDQVSNPLQIKKES